MSWTAYRVSLRLLSPAHLGWRKLGNMQQTRQYVTGRVMWGALTARLARAGGGDYTRIGQQVDDELALGYLYPSSSPERVELWPWGSTSDDFTWAYLGSFASSALQAGGAVEPGSLHETELIAPRTRDGEPVYLVGHIFEQEGCTLAWRDALWRLQVGGERSYGWGRVRPVDSTPTVVDTYFGLELDSNDARPAVIVPSERPLLAHTQARVRRNWAGTIEPLVGRETGGGKGFGGQLTPADICWTPGTMVSSETRVTMGRRGIWQVVEDAA